MKIILIIDIMSQIVWTLLYVAAKNNSVAMSDSWLSQISHLLLPMSMITILEFECWRASSNQVVKWLKVSLLLKQTQIWFYYDSTEKTIQTNHLLNAFTDTRTDFIFTCKTEHDVVVTSSCNVYIYLYEQKCLILPPLVDQNWNFH